MKRQRRYLMKNIYVCGPTVYAKAHIGNLRPIVSFDIYVRSLKFLGEKVNLIHNITDIDDKIIVAAKEQGISEASVAKNSLRFYKKMLGLVNVRTITEMPTVVENLDKIIAYIENLIIIGYAYELNGSVYFDVQKDTDYGSLSKRKLNGMHYEEKVEGKKHPADFALWKQTEDGVKFDSPWSKGRPGWHTECAAIINRTLPNDSLDIHGGGVDLKFPHHENEAAQHRVTTGLPLTHEWRHTGQINLEGKKMSKSLQNSFDADVFIRNYGANVLRTIFLTSSYSAPIELTEESLTQAMILTRKIKKIFLRAQAVPEMVHEPGDRVKEIAGLISNWSFAGAMKILNNLLKEFVKKKTSSAANDILGAIKLLGYSFSNTIISQEDKELVDKWNLLRSNLEYKEADKLREILLEKGLI